jgi:hypothetical protein
MPTWTQPRLGRRAFGSTIAATSLALALAACGGSSSTGASSPPPPARPGASFYVADRFTSSQRVARVVVDAGTIWLLDANGDLVFGSDPHANWDASTGLTLSWKQVYGATKYHVLARNTVTSPTTWQELQVVAAPDPLLNPIVVASGIKEPWAKGLGTGGNPWSFGNHIEFAVSSENTDHVLSDTSLPALLDTSDQFPGFLAGIEVDHPGLPVPFDSHVELGSSFTKTIRLSFSEPMSTAAAPTLTSQSANLTIRSVEAFSWGTDEVTPGASAASAATHAFLGLAMRVKGACTELLVSRWAGDVFLDVHDASFFTVGGGSRLLFLDASTGGSLAEAVGLSSLDGSQNRLTLAAGLPADLAPGTLACATSGAGATIANLASAAGLTAQVDDATPFRVGERIAVHTPGTAGAGPIDDVRTVAGLDSTARLLVLSAPLSDGQGAGAVVLPLPALASEVALRASAPLHLARDAIGGPDVELFVTQPTDLMVGDTVLVDGDGRLDTTPDQAQARVKEVRFAPRPGAPVASIVVDLPTGLTLLHGRAVVIGLGDAFQVGGTHDTSSTVVAPLDPHRDQFSPDGLLY